MAHKIIFVPLHKREALPHLPLPVWQLGARDWLRLSLESDVFRRRLTSPHRKVSKRDGRSTLRRCPSPQREARQLPWTRPTSQVAKHGQTNEHHAKCRTPQLSHDPVVQGTPVRSHLPKRRQQHQRQVDLRGSRDVYTAPVSSEAPRHTRIETEVSSQK